MHQQPSQDPRPANCRGVTLIELIFTLAIAAILGAISLPALGGLMQSSQSRSTQNVLATALNLARSAAVNRQGVVVACPSADQVHCDKSLWWQHGWIIFSDSDLDGKRGNDEPLLGITQAQPGMAIASSAGRMHVTYRNDGSATGTNLTFTFCDRRGATHAGALVVNNAGRVRQGKPSAAQAAFACSGL